MKAPEVAQKSAQTDIESEQTSLLKSLVEKTYATKYELKSLRDNLTLEILKLRDDIMLTQEGMLLSQSLPDPVSPSLAVPSSSRSSTLHSIHEYPVSVPNTNTTESNTPSVEHGNTKHNILVAGDSLLHRLDANKMCVEQIKVKKLTKPGDTLNGTFSRIKDYVTKHSDVQLEVVVLAGTNDLNRRNVTPQSLIDQLVDHIAVLKEFCNIKNIFVCKFTPRCDRHVKNSKVSEYSKLLDEHFSSRDSLTVLPTIPLEASLLYKDNLHLSAKGLRQVSGIILSNLYQVLAPNSYRPGLRRKSKSGRNAKSSNKAKNRKY